MATTTYDPVQHAFNKCIRDFETELHNDGLYKEILKTTSINQVYDMTEKLQEEMGKKDSLRHLAKISPFLERLRGYTDSIDTFVQAKPDILALIWGPIKLLLQWASVLKQSFDAIIDTIGCIGDLLPEFQEVMKLFGHNEHIKDVLVLFFRDILDFYVVALKFFSLGRLKFIFEAMWPRQRDKIQVIMSHIERHTSLMRNEVRLEHIREEHEARLRALEHFDRTERSHRLQEYNAIKEAISPRTYEGDLDRIRSRICEGTGKWLLRNDTFIKWLDQSDMSVRLMWLEGIPGAGKTFLSSTIVNKALSQGRTLFAFLSYKFSSTTSALSIIHSLLFQLSSDDDDLEAILCQSTAKELRREMKIAMGLLSTLLNAAGPVFIVIDGVDEIDEIERCRFLNCLLELLKSCDEVKILVCSRMEDDIRTVLNKKAVNIRIDKQNAGSIQAFIKHHAEQWFLSRSFLPEACAEIRRLLAPLSSKAKVYSAHPKTHTNFCTRYARILARINNLHPRTRDKALKILGWIGSSPTPLTIQEIEQMSVIRMDDSDGNFRVIARLNPTRVCGPILEVVDDYVQFVHFTVKEYIFSPDIPGSLNISDATLSLAMCCIQYLCQRHHDTDLQDDEIHQNILSGAYRLHEYSATMWLELVKLYSRSVKLTDPSKDLIYLLQLFFEKRSNNKFEDHGIRPPVRCLNQQLSKSSTPDVYEVLRHAANFRQKCSDGDYSIRKDISWTSLNPLTVVQTSIRLYDALDQLLCGGGAQHKEECHCVVIGTHFGQRPYKCEFLGCPFGRYGFPDISSRKSHATHHELPWKCSRPDCQFSKGFLSRKMRDQHWEQCHREKTKAVKFEQIPDEDEIQPLLFDLVRNDKVQVFESLLPLFATCSQGVKDALFRLAASSRSTAMVRLFGLQDISPGAGITPGISAAVDSANMEMFTYLLEVSRHLQESSSFGKEWPVYLDFLEEMIISENRTFIQDLDVQIDNDRRLWKNQRCSFGLQSIDQRVLKTVKGNPDNAATILLIWEKIGLAKDFTTAYRGDALVNVASSCCSVQLAKYLIDAGAPINHRRTAKYMTPLHHAATHDTSEAAKLIKFLFASGADPESFSTSGPRSSNTVRRIRDEKGARGISRWLGESWDELVERTKVERAKLAV
ncbi:hypothetical protein DL98DRAFT_486212 [Cadophora sp. DSE1049]|nr:hypothetical protein DL98DRAFT_486212 [Cadophora sp. DSE1049]